MINNIHDIGCRIQRLRADKGITQDMLAQQLHISSCYAGKLEQGIRTPSLELCISLAEYFNVSLDYLILGKSTNQQEKEIKRNLQSAIKQLQWIEKQL